MSKQYYTKKGKIIYNPSAYAKTGAPMYEHPCSNVNINKKTHIYKLNLEDGKKYVGKTTNINKRMDQHFSGNGAKVTQKFKPIQCKVVDEVPGFFSDEIEQSYTEKYIQKYGYDNVRGGKYTNSTTLHGPIKCSRCGRSNHTKDSCYAKIHIKGYHLKY